LLNPFKRYSEKVGQPPGTLIYLGEEPTEPVRITIIDYDETHLQEAEVQTVEECLPFIDTETVTWIQVQGIHETPIIEEIGKHFGVNSLVLEDLMNPSHLPKIEVYENYVFIVLKSLDYNVTDSRVSREQISLIVGANFVITLQESFTAVFASVQNRLLNQQGRIRRMQSGYLAYALIDIIVDHYFIVLDEVNEQVQVLEEDIMKDPSPEIISKINVLRKEQLLLRRPILPLRDVLIEILDDEIPLLGEDTRPYFRDVYDHLIQVIQMLEMIRSAVSGLFDVYTSAVSHRMNEVMKVLTIVATFFIPLTFIAGIYGMNFKFMPELDTQWGYPVVLLVMLSISIGMFLFFKFKKWL
jgi:magnesium transporter